MTLSAHSLVIFYVLVMAGKIGPVVRLLWIGSIANIAMHWHTSSPMKTSMESLITSLVAFPIVMTLIPTMPACAFWSGRNTMLSHSSMNSVSLDSKLPTNFLHTPTLGIEFTHLIH